MSSVALSPPQEGVAAPSQCQDDELNYEQSQMCEQNPEAMPYVGDGIAKGLQECKHQFAYERWNCSAARGGLSPVGPVLNEGTYWYFGCYNISVVQLSTIYVTVMLRSSCRRM